MPLTDDERALLSPEEIAAIEDTTGDPPDDEPAGKDLPGDKDAAAERAAEAAAKAKAEADKAKADADAADAAKAKDDTDAAAKAKAEADAKAKAAAEAGMTDEQKAAKAKEEADAKAKADAAAAAKAEDEAGPPPEQPYIHMMPRVDKAKMETAKSALDDAQTKYDEGEIDYQALDKAKTAYNELKWKDDQALEYNQSARQGAWQHASQVFYERYPQFSGSGNRSLHLAFVSVVNEAINNPDAAKMSDWQLLEKARKQVEADLSGLLSPEAREALAKADAERKREAAKRAAIKGAGDRTKLADDDLGKLPSATDGNDNDEFAYIDKLTGQAFQAAVEALTPAQRERYEDAR